MSRDVVQVSGGGRVRALPPWVWIGLFFVIWALLVGREQVASHTPRHVGDDFNIFWHAGRNLRMGRNPYVPVRKNLGFVYPPFALLPFAALSLLPMFAAYLVWLGLGAALVTAMLWLGARSGMSRKVMPIVLLAVLFNGYTQRNAWYGQMGFLLCGMVALDMVGVGKRRGAGILTGVVAGVKFTPGIMVIYFLARRQWRAAATMAASFLATVLVGVIATPHWSHVYWSRLLVHHNLGTGVPRAYANANNQGVTNALIMLVGHATPGVIQAGRCVALVLAVVTVLAGARAAMLERPWLSSGLLGIASCMVTSSTWDHHYAWYLLLLLAAGCGEMRRLRVSLLLLAAWTLTSYPRSWVILERLQRDRMTSWQVVQSITTPVMASLFCICCLVELAVTSGPGRSGRLRTPDEVPDKLGAAA